MPSPLLRGIMQENLLQRQKEYSDTNPLADAPQPLLHRSSEPGRSVTATSDLSDQSDQSSGSTAASGLRLTAAASQNNNHPRRGRRRSLDPQDLTDECAAAVERHNARATVGLEQPIVSTRTVPKGRSWTTTVCLFLPCLRVNRRCQCSSLVRRSPSRSCLEPATSFSNKYLELP